MFAEEGIGSKLRSIIVVDALREFHNKSLNKVSVAMIDVLFRTFGICLVLLLACCNKNPSFPPSKTPQGGFDLVPTNISFVSGLKVGAEMRITIKYSVLNAGNSVVAARTYDVKLYLDDRLIAFDKAAPIILPRTSTDYSFEYQVPLGKHSYRIIVDSINGVQETKEGNNDVTGLFNVQ